MPFVVMQHAQSVECPSVPKILPLVGHNKVFMAVETAGNVFSHVGFQQLKSRSEIKHFGRILHISVSQCILSLLCELRCCFSTPI